MHARVAMKQDITLASQSVDDRSLERFTLSLYVDSVSE